MHSRLKPLAATAALALAAFGAHAQENLRWGIPMAFGVFSKRGMSLERPDLGDARGVDPL